MVDGYPAAYPNEAEAVRRRKPCTPPKKISEALIPMFFKVALSKKIPMTKKQKVSIKETLDYYGLPSGMKAKAKYKLPPGMRWRFPLIFKGRSPISFIPEHHIRFGCLLILQLSRDPPRVRDRKGTNNDSLHGFHLFPCSR